MARLPNPGGDQGVWGDVLNDFLNTSHKTDGTLKDDSVTAATLAPGAVNTASIQDGTISEAKLDGALQTKVNAAGGNPSLGGDLSGTVSNAQIVAGVVGATELATNAVSTIKVQDGAITGPKLANGSVTSTKLGVVSAPASGQILSYNGTNLEWISGTSATDLDDLTDVNTTGATDGQSLVYQSGTWTPATVTGGGGVTDHGALTGLSDDDHPQYHNDARGDTRYYTKAQADSALGAKVDTAQVGAVNGVASLDGTGKVPTSQLPAGVAPDATTSSKGIVQLAGDLAGTAAAPTVPGLANKANSAVTISGTSSITGGGNLTTNRTLSLVNDSAAPGASRYYGTDGTGIKGYFTLPAGGGGAVDSVNGQTGAVVLDATDISGFAVVATTGAYNDLSGRPAAAIPLTSQATWPIVPARTTATVDYNTGSSSYPARPTSRTDIVVRWRGPVAPTVGGTGAVDNVDEWVNTP